MKTNTRKQTRKTLKRVLANHGIAPTAKVKLSLLDIAVQDDVRLDLMPWDRRWITRMGRKLTLRHTSAKQPA